MCVALSLSWIINQITVELSSCSNQTQHLENVNQNVAAQKHTNHAIHSLLVYVCVCNWVGTFPKNGIACVMVIKPYCVLIIFRVAGYISFGHVSYAFAYAYAYASYTAYLADSGQAWSKILNPCRFHTKDIQLHLIWCAMHAWCTSALRWWLS